MIPRTFRARMPLRTLSASPRVPATPSQRLSALARHMASSSSSPQGKASTDQTLPEKLTNQDEEAPVLIRSELNSRTYILNRPKQLNALNIGMINFLQKTVQEWEKSPRCHVIIGLGNGRAFCAGGDVKSIVQGIVDGRPEDGIKFFKDEFELDYALASLETPYVAILDGLTMGGGVGLSINAAFRVATEKTVFAMPETKIGYSPDVGSTFVLPQLDGALGMYLGLTGESLFGREVFEAGLATHYVASSRIPEVLERLHSLDRPTEEVINATLEEFYSERLPEDPPSRLAGSWRMAADDVFSAKTLEDIFARLEALKANSEHPQQEWASKTLDTLELRSPTSLRVAFALLSTRVNDPALAFKRELDVATAYCNGASADFVTGVTSLLIDKVEGRPPWKPSDLANIGVEDVQAKFFSAESPYLKGVPKTNFSTGEALPTAKKPMRWSLPPEREIGRLVRGEHPASSSTAFTLEELIERVQQLYQGKQGIEEKVRDVVDRRCERKPQSGMEEAHLRWIH